MELSQHLPWRCDESLTGSQQETPLQFLAAKMDVERMLGDGCSLIGRNWGYAVQLVQVPQVSALP